MMTWDDLTLRGRLNHALDVFERHGGPGLEVWSYFQYFHSKHLLADQVAVVIGSFNLEKISALQSFEIALLCHDSELVRQVQEMTALDLLNSVPMLRRRSD
jgi:phosphatidylserine/phosphatidylglycerophosphate/cardiolipin synthase-like enzyme